MSAEEGLMVDYVDPEIRPAVNLIAHVCAKCGGVVSDVEAHLVWHRYLTRTIWFLSEEVIQGLKVIAGDLVIDVEVMDEGP